MSAEQATFEKLCNHARQAAVLESTLAVLEWDERTMLPPAGGDYRAEQIACLAGMVHERETAPQVGEWLTELKGSSLAAEPHGDAGAVIHQMQRDFERKRKLPQTLVEELARVSIQGQQIWAEARRNDSFRHFQPILEKIISLKKQEAEAIGYQDTPYDALLDDYEPGEKTANVVRVFGALQKELVPLVERIVGSGRQPDRSIWERHYPIAAQEAFGKQVAAAVGFDFRAGRLDVSNHPFNTGLGPRDTRMTTRYAENSFSGSLFGILHESGHAIYDQGLPADQYGLPTGEAVSLGIHESQSRLWENLVGRSRAFWDHFYPAAQAAFREPLAGVSLDDFYFAVNDVQPSLLRTEADEVTYNLHIFVRFDLERALLEDDLPVADLPSAWAEKYQQYLGVTPPNDADGVLQDIHWSGASFGYFPTYALGNLYASQFFAQAEADLGDLPGQFRRGEFAPLRDWLRQNIHQHGRRYSAAQLVERITGQPLSHAALIKHLQTKFGPLYGV